MAPQSVEKNALIVVPFTNGTTRRPQVEPGDAPGAGGWTTACGAVPTEESDAAAGADQVAPPSVDLITGAGSPGSSSCSGRRCSRCRSPSWPACCRIRCRPFGGRVACPRRVRDDRRRPGRAVARAVDDDAEHAAGAPEPAALDEPRRVARVVRRGRVGRTVEREDRAGRRAAARDRVRQEAALAPGLAAVGAGRPADGGRAAVEDAPDLEGRDEGLRADGRGQRRLGLGLVQPDAVHDLVVVHELQRREGGDAPADASGSTKAVAASAAKPCFRRLSSPSPPFAAKGGVVSRLGRYAAGCGSAASPVHRPQSISGFPLVVEVRRARS